jgi:hypothetical protein
MTTSSANQHRFLSFVVGVALVSSGCGSTVSSEAVATTRCDAVQLGERLDNQPDVNRPCPGNCWSLIHNPPDGGLAALGQGEMVRLGPIVYFTNGSDPTWRGACCVYVVDGGIAAKSFCSVSD